MIIELQNQEYFNGKGIGKENIDGKGIRVSTVHGSERWPGSVVDACHVSAPGWELSVR